CFASCRGADVRLRVAYFLAGTLLLFFFFFQAEDGIRDDLVTGVQTCALPISFPFSVCLRQAPRNGNGHGKSFRHAHYGLNVSSTVLLSLAASVTFSSFSPSFSWTKARV